MGFEMHTIQQTIASSGGEQVANFLKTKFVDELGCATSAEYDGAINMVSDGLSVSIATNGVATLTYKNSSSRNYTISTSANTVDRVYIAQTAIVIVLTGGNATYYYIFAKTNTNKMAIVVTGSQSPYGIYDVSSGDDTGATPSAYTRSSSYLASQLPYSNQVQICPLACNSSSGVVSYLQDVYIATMTTLPAVRSTQLYDYILGDHHYLTDGAFWIKGDPV